MCFGNPKPCLRVVQSCRHFPLFVRRAFFLKACFGVPKPCLLRFRLAAGTFFRWETTCLFEKRCVFGTKDNLFVNMCQYLTIFVHIYKCTYLRVALAHRPKASIYTYIYMYVYMLALALYIYTYIHIYININISLSLSIYIYIYIHIYIHIYTYIYIYIYVHISISVYIYIYIYTHMCMWWFLVCL